MSVYYAKDGQEYGDLEESILACLLIEPKYMERLLVEEKHFRKFGYVFTFMKEFYAKYKCFDLTLMFSLVKSGSEMTLLDTISYLMEIFVIPTHCEKYQKQLIGFYYKTKKNEWIRKKIYEKTMSMYVGNIDVERYRDEIDRIYANAEKIEWK